MISTAALSEYLTKANKWKIITKCSGTLIQSIFIFESISVLYNGRIEEPINL